MSNLIFAIMTSLATVTFASQPMPAALECHVQDNPEIAQKLNPILMTELNSEEPESNIPDARFTGKSNTRGQLSLFFSNECDNGFEFHFRIKDLQKLERIQTGKIFAKLDAQHSDFSPEFQQVTVTCVLLAH